MHETQEFDFNQPSRDTLAGILVEASDLAQIGLAEPSSSMKKPAVLDRIFGHMVSVEDENSAARHNPSPT